MVPSICVQTNFKFTLWTFLLRTLVLVHLELNNAPTHLEIRQKPCTLILEYPKLHHYPAYSKEKPGHDRGTLFRTILGLVLSDFPCAMDAARAKGVEFPVFHPATLMGKTGKCMDEYSLLDPFTPPSMARQGAVTARVEESEAFLLVHMWLVWLGYFFFPHCCRCLTPLP